MDMHRNHSVARLLVFILLGLIIGGVFGEVLGLILGQIGVLTGGEMNNPIRNFFVAAIEYSVGIKEGGILIDLYMIKFRLGFGIKVNLCSVAGLFLSLYVMKWSK
jgi:hypothetical protein